MIFEKLDGGTLLHNIWRRGLLSEHDVSEVVKDIADGLYFLHQKGKILAVNINNPVVDEVLQLVWVSALTRLGDKKCI